MIAKTVLSMMGSLLVLAGCKKTPDSMLPVGAQVPELSAVDQNGKAHKLSDFRGRPVVVYFYPKDATPGCTKEACAFRDVWERFQKANVAVVGVSADGQASKAKFASKHNLPFPILADPEKQWIEAFGVPTRLGMATRVTFLIDGGGNVSKVYPNVDPGVHATQVLQDAASLS